MASLEQEIGDLLRAKGLTLGVVESASGGLIAHTVTNAPNSSDYFKGSITAYQNETKMHLLGVRPETLEKHGAVSAQTVEEMADGGRQRLNVDICISDTGIAGPGGATPGKPVGLFYIGLSHRNKTISEKHLFGRDRIENKQYAAEAALLLLWQYLSKLKK